MLPYWGCSCLAPWQVMAVVLWLVTNCRHHLAAEPLANQCSGMPIGWEMRRREDHADKMIHCAEFK